MNFRTMFAAATFALAGSIGIGWANSTVGPTRGVVPALGGYQLAQDEHNERHRDQHRQWDWYQGQRGHWDRDKDNDQYRWRGDEGDQWYQGQRGHWYQEQEGWRFGTAGIICNNQGRNCRQGGYLPANGEGMVSRTNPRMFWHCDSEGHNCNWARRPF